MSTTAVLDINFTDARKVANVGVTSKWLTAISSGLNVADSTPTNADTFAATRYLLDSENRAGTHMLVRIKDVLATVAGTVVLVAYGRTTTDEGWMVLPTKAGATSLSITIPAVAVAKDTTYAYTDASNLDNAFDRLGCRYAIIGVQSTTIASTTAALQVKAL